MATATDISSLEVFHPCTQEWFRRAFDEPTRVQQQAWLPISRGESTLLLAPTGSGKTLAAFLAAIDRLFFEEAEPGAEPGIRVLYISPLKALGVDVDRNLRAPIAGLRAFAESQQQLHRVPRVAVRSGDTSQRERQQIVRNPPDILITTPESLYLMLTSRADQVLKSVDTVIVDEIHAVAATKRGSHLFVTLERLQRLRDRSQVPSAGERRPLQRIGLSATQRPLQEIARLLGGGMATADADSPPGLRPVTIVDASEKRRISVTVESPAEEQQSQDASAEADIPIGSAASAPLIPSVWPSIHPRLVELIRQNRSTMIFVNSRRLAERLANAINDVAEEELALAHHGSVAKDKRAEIEDRLKQGTLPAIVATSSMELGIDMGAVDLVIQIEAPPTIASGTQRIGRSGHHVGGVSTGIVIPKYKADLLACSAATGAMLEGWVEETRYPRNPLDVLAQQIVAIVSREALPVDELYGLLRGAAPFFDLPRSSFDGVLDLLSGRYPSDEFSELRPRINLDRVNGTVAPRRGTQRLAILNGGTIPDRGLYGVFLVGDEDQPGSRVGELDEEMVFECRPGDVFLLGASAWRVMDITRDRVLVVPAPGEPGRMPFWKGDGPGRPLEFGRAIGQLTRALIAEQRDQAVLQLTTQNGLTEMSAHSLLDYLQDQQTATTEVPSDQAIVIESFLDEVGDWRIVVLSPFGSRVHAPWAMVISERMRAEYSDEVDVMWTDDGIVFRLPEACAVPDMEYFFPSPDSVEEELIRILGGTALFSARFRENAARSLLLPRRSPNKRTPLWLQRRKSSDLLKVAAGYPEFPMLMETYRECLQDVFDVKGLVTLLRDVQRRSITVRQIQTDHPSPFAAAVLFNYVGNFIYDSDVPLAEKRAATLSLDHAQLRELLGSADFRELFDADVIEQVALELQRADGYRIRDEDDLHELLLHLGPQTLAELERRSDSEDQDTGPMSVLIERLIHQRRAFSCQISHEVRIAAAEDAARLRDALGVVPPGGLADAFLEPVADALTDLVSRYARTHVPFTVGDVATYFGLGPGLVTEVLSRLVRQGRLLEGEFLPGGQGREWCETKVFQMLKRRSLAALRKQVEPVDEAALARFLPVWHGISRPRRGLDGVLDVVQQLQGMPLAASDLEDYILPARLADYRPSALDELCLAGEVVWQGVDSTGPRDGRIMLFLTDDAPILSMPRQAEDNEMAKQIRELLGRKGAQLFDQICGELSGFPNDILDEIWRMVWNGEITNDTLTPLRSQRAGQKSSNRSSRLSSNRFRSRRAARLPGSEGRWSLFHHADTVSISPTERQTRFVQQLLQRHGIVTREMLSRESFVGGFSGLYPVLKAMEEAGRIRRGYFVAGLGGAQFAAPGVEDLLRNHRDEAEDACPVIMAATDPANPWGAALNWPASTDSARPQRTAGARVIVDNGSLLAYLNRTGTAVTTFMDDAESGHEDRENRRGMQAVAAALAGLASPGRSLLIKRIDGKSAAESPLAESLLGNGFSHTSRGFLHTGRGIVRAEKTRPGTERHA
jgi:ATP-dependent Lhr-like helicase